LLTEEDAKRVSKIMESQIQGLRKERDEKLKIQVGFIFDTSMIYQFFKSDSHLQPPPTLSVTSSQSNNPQQPPAEAVLDSSELHVQPAGLSKYSF